MFLGGPQQARTVSIISWNLNGVKTKLEKDNVKELLYRYDVISVNEVKTPLSISLLGYVTYKVLYVDQVREVVRCYLSRNMFRNLSRVWTQI